MEPPTFNTPPHLHNTEGKTRSVGFELEFAGVPIEEVVDLVHRLYGGEKRYDHPYRPEVDTEELGVFKIELDWALLSDPEERQRVRGLIESPQARELVERAEEVIANLALAVVPVEVVSPPIPLHRLKDLELLREGLRKQGALGTGGSVVYAFGMHLNPEAASFEASSILAHLQAFLLLQDWLSKNHNIDLSRRLAPYINPFGKDYLALVLADGYTPSLGELIDLYLEHNPTRNRPLDFLPLFAHLDEERVLAQVEDPLVGSRPAYHYRLPGCRVDQPEWTLAKEWNLWLVVEGLAADPPRLEAMRQAWLEYSNATFGIFQDSWDDQLEEWLS